MTTDTKPLDTGSRVTSVLTVIGCHACPERRRLEATVNTLRAELSARKDAAAAHLAAAATEAEGCHACPERDRLEALIAKGADTLRAETEIVNTLRAELAAYKKQAEWQVAFLSDERDAYKAQAQEDVERIADLRAALNERDNLIIELRDHLSIEPGEPTTGPLTYAQRMQATRLLHRLALDAAEAANLREENAKILARLDKSEVKL
jgi:hypothetical protein